MLRVPSSMVNQTITLKKYLGESGGTYPEPKYAEPVEITKANFQPQTIYQGTNNDRQIVANAVVFLYAGISSPLPKLTQDNLQSIITFEGHDYTLQRLVDNRHPFSNELWSYELEVL